MCDRWHAGPDSTEAELGSEHIEETLTPRWRGNSEGQRWSCKMSFTSCSSGKLTSGRTEGGQQGAGVTSCSSGKLTSGHTEGGQQGAGVTSCSSSYGEADKWSHWASREANRVPVLHLASLVPRPPPFFVLRFSFSPCIILNENQRTKNRGGLGTRLTSCSSSYGEADKQSQASRDFYL